MIVGAREFLRLAAGRSDSAATRLLLVDTASVDADVFRSVHVVSEDEVAASHVEVGNAHRRLSLLVDDGESVAAPGGSLGILAKADVVHLALQSGSFGLSFVHRCVEQNGPFDVIGLCVPFDRPPEPQLLAELGRLAESSLVVATSLSAEIDLGPDVLNVRVTSSSTGAGGPCVHFAPGAAISARAQDGSLGHLNLLDAAVPLVVGWAAVWYGRLHATGVECPPPALRAIAIAGLSGPAPWSETKSDAVPCILRVEPGDEPYSFELSPRGEDPVALAAVAVGARRSPLWFTEQTELALRLDGALTQPSALSGDAWARLQADAPKSPMRCVLSRSSAAGDIVIAAFGAHAITRSGSLSRTPQARRPLTIVGISASHDASACVLRDGKLLRAIQLERLTRLKHDGRAFLHSRQAVDYCLASLGLAEKDVDFFAFNCMPLSPPVTGLGLPSHDESFHLFDPFGERAVFVSHHLCHAFGAFFGAPFESATVIVADGSGGRTVGRSDVLVSGTDLRAYLSTPTTQLDPLHVFSVYRFDQQGWTLVDREHAEGFNTLSGVSHLGEAYATASSYVFGDWQASGKVMGLAPYGDPDRFGPSLLLQDGHGRLQFGTQWKNQHRRALRRGSPMEYKDFAARIQRDLETALIGRFRAAIARTKCTDVAYAGGIALNSVANQRLRTETGATALYIMPSCHDAGISIGAAAGAHHLVTGQMASSPLLSDAFGHSYGPRDIEAALAQFRGLIQTREVDLDEVVTLLAARKILGWFDGGAEFGPRALGQRSLLAAPTDREMWTYINRRIKFREDFRPFAPMVPEEVASEFFEIDEPSPFMLRVVRVRERYRNKLGAITHVDGTARVQTVRRDVLPKMHELLHRVGARLGIPVLVNTSFNVRGEPLVETPLQAIEMLLATHLDAVVFSGSVLVQPHAIESLTSDVVLQLPPKCRLEARCAIGEQRHLLVPGARGSDAAIELPDWAYSLLSRLDGVRNVSSVVGELPPDRRAPARQLLEALASLRLLAVCRDQPRHSSAVELSPGAVPRAASEASGTTPSDPTPLVAGTQRTATLADTIARVRARLGEMQVGRIADVSDYDHLRVPVVSCIRPFVSDEDITCTQGKGLVFEQALASALMETAERYVGWHHQHIRTRIAEATELTRSSEAFLPVSRLGGSDEDSAAIEWVWAEGLVGNSRWVPAAAVFAPYKAPAGVATPLSWCSTGLSAGNTILEAVAHGLLEVVERDALTRYVSGQGGRLLDLSTLPSGPERELLERFRQAGLDLFVIALDDISPLPTFSVALFEPEGPEPRIAVSGQGCNPSPLIALQRALLEAAQSRVVAIQGSREDLVRHGSGWVEDDAARAAHWISAREAAARGGVVPFPPPTPAPGTVGELLAQVFMPLKRRGFREVLYVDLTHPRIGIPVACVLVPGMYDGDTIPQRRNRM